VGDAPFAYEGYYNYTPVNQFTTNGVSAQVDYDFSDSVTLTSISAFRSLSRFENVDSDFTSAQLLDPSGGNRTDVEIDTFTQEFRLSGSTDSTNWMVGTYIFDEDVEQDTAVYFGSDFRSYADVLGGGIPGNSVLNSLEGLFAYPQGTFFGQGQGVAEFATMDDKASSFFGQVDISLGDRTTLTLGANYTEDEKDVTFDSTHTDVYSSLDLNNDLTVYGVPLPTVLFGQEFTGATGLAPTPANIGYIESVAPGTSAAINAGVAAGIADLQGLQFLLPNVDFPNSVESGNTKDDDTTWTVRLAFDVSDDLNVYASAGTGFKASSWNLSRDSRPFSSDQAGIEAAGLTVPNLGYTTRFAVPEESMVYEVGLKARWDTVALNLAYFDQAIKGFQSNIFLGTGFSLANAGKQSTTGLEVDIRWQPVDSFQATIAAAFLDPLYDSFVGASGITGPIDLSGTQPAGIHEVSIATSGRYEFTMGNAAGFVRAEYIYEDEVQVVDNAPVGAAVREVSTLNASVGLSWESGFGVMLWARNLNNDEYLMSAFPSVAQPGSFSGYPNQPRTYGLTVRKYFD
jgi:outer membrane receptor protein involved in Fe transport